jgi:hypothetical protein
MDDTNGDTHKDTVHTIAAAGKSLQGW